MEPDVDPPLLPLQAVRQGKPTNDHQKLALARSHSSSSHSRRAARPAPGRPPQSSTKGDVARVPASAIPATSARPATHVATRVASQLGRSHTSSTPLDRIAAATAVPFKQPPASHRTRGQPPTRSSRTAPVLPLSERNQGKNALVSRSRQNSASERSDITPDGGSGGREARRFAVSNVGNNGRIYLRPTTRPAQERHPQPSFVFPITPPQTAGLGATDITPNIFDFDSPHDSQQWPSDGPSTPSQSIFSRILDDQDISRPRVRRALSDSTIRESSVARDSADGFKIVITRPGEDRRPKSVEDINDREPHFLDISIPSGKLGTPRWSARGTPLIRGSSYAPTEEVRSNLSSPLTSHSSTVQSRGASSLMPSCAAHKSHIEMSDFGGSAGLAQEHVLRATYMSTHLFIEPNMFDDLTFKPGCDDPAIVRYSAVTGAVTAATPSRLVAEITSATFLDYELLSDFFLTFRSYLAPLDLLKMLFARMRWSLGKTDEVGTVVRVRTFVAIRHWILNYFVDDFVVEYEMRTQFCLLMNSLSEEMAHSQTARRVQLKILAELKKCWRRVCAQFWDGPEFDPNHPAEVPIAPGGIPGHRNPSLDPDFWKQFLCEGPPQLAQVHAPLANKPLDAETSFYREVAQAGTEEDRIGLVSTGRSGTLDNETGGETTQQDQLSPTSPSSVEAVSCSLPLKLHHQKPRQQLGAHPVDPSLTFASTQPVAATPRALQGKRVRPNQTHKQNKDSTDSMRQHTTALEKMLRMNTKTLMSLPYAGSLVRGNVLPPGQAFVEVLTPTSYHGSSRQTTYLRLETDQLAKERGPPAAMSGQGMRRLIGSVRRVLTTKGQQISPTQGNFNITPIGPRGVTANRLPGTAIVPQSRPRANNARLPVRIDLLGAVVVEDFKKVVREDAAEAAAEAAAAHRFSGSVLSTSAAVHLPDEVGLNTSTVDLRSGLQDEDGMCLLSRGGLSPGGTSTVMFDDSLRPSMGLHTMAGALGTLSPSVDVFDDSFLASGAEPSPPNTPEGRTADTPRRSSEKFGHNIHRPASSLNDLPPFAPDLDSLRGGAQSRAFGNLEPPSFHAGQPRSSDLYRRQSSVGPPLSGLGQRHALYQSGRSFASTGTNGSRRRASSHSGIDRHSTLRSFDATTYSYRSSLGNSIAPSATITALPEPLRILRRRPGGDLRAVGNVVDLGRHDELRRSRSLGSLTTGTYTSSFGTSLILSPGRPRDTSGLVEVANSDCSRDQRAAFSLGAMAEKSKRNISLLSSFASRPIMRPSFEVEAQKLANIPDDDDDGGVESALSKLEGRYDKKVLRLSMEPIKLKPAKKLVRPPPLSPVGASQVTAETKKDRHRHIEDNGLAPHSPLAESDSPVLPCSPSTFVAAQGERPSLRPQVQVDVQSVSSGFTDTSYGSIPLLQRGLTDDGWRSRKESTNQSIYRDESEEDSANDESRDDRVSYEFVRKSSSMEKIQPGETMPTHKRNKSVASQISQGSYLNVENSDDELSSELSDIPMEEDEDDMAIPTLRPHALLTKIRTSNSHRRLDIARDHDDSRPVETATPTVLPGMEMMPDHRNHSMCGPKPLPLSPDDTPALNKTGTNKSSKNSNSAGHSGVNAALRSAACVTERESTTRKYAAHLPFVLAFESAVLAQQFTLIEKDALNEIDWKELIDMRWKNADNNDSRSWVRFLRDTDARGVEVVIARFNIVVKWAISEIVLTQDIEERARTIIKYIHIAAHCRRYRNFATMSQIAVALTSGEIGRLTKTWKMVPSTDLRTLHQLETLISPTRNFYALRAEMEGGGLATAGMGCIPFVGIYTHDLIFNSQRPSEIASSRTTAPLVNFERCRIAAGIVKALLRLLEASNLYDFQPIEGIIERCLWMSALTDEGIRWHSSRLE